MPSRPLRKRLEPLVTLFDATRGRALPLPPALARLYGELRIPAPRGRPYVISNFVVTLDGIVSLGEKGHASGGDISGFSSEDRAVMGLLRAVADVIVVGAGTLEVDRRHVWTAEKIYPPLAEEYGRLRAALGKRGPPLMVIVSGSGRIDLGLPLFQGGAMPVLVVTTGAGARRLRKQDVPGSVTIRAVPTSSAIRAKSILAAIRRVNKSSLVLVEGGPRLLGDFLAEGLLDELFLTLAPQVAGRMTGDRRLGLVMGRVFAPGAPLFGQLLGVRRGGNHLYLRYRFREG